MCILQVRGVRPFLSKKYDITSHKHYRFLSDANPKNKFNLQKHINRKLVVKPSDEYEYFEFVPVDDELPTEALVDSSFDNHYDDDFDDDLEPF